MGNSNRSGKIRFTEEQTKEHLSKCLEKVYELDGSVISFLNAIDMMIASLRMITEYESTNNESKPNAGGISPSSEISWKNRLTKDVLIKLENSIFTEKEISLHKIQNLMQFVVDSAKKVNMPGVENLKVNKYKADFNFETSFVDSLQQTKDNEIHKLNGTIRELKQSLELIQNMDDNLRKERKHILVENKALNDLNELNDKEKEKLGNEITSLEKDIKEMKARYFDELNAEKVESQKITEQKDNQIASLNNTINELDREVKGLNKNILQERRQVEYLKATTEKLNAELENMKCKRVLQVQLFYQRRGGLITEVEENLKEVLKTHIEDGKTELNFISCQNMADIRSDLPTLLIAICASRLGTDAANAIQGLELNQNILLLIFHHKDVHALPSQASERVLTGQEFKTLGGIHDMAFLSQKGIYSCQMNEKSIAAVLSFLYM